MNVNKSDDMELSCEKCGTALSADEASRTTLFDGHVHVFCQSCMQHVLIVKDGSLQF
jgi:RNase P subunit RPR2